jgi:hypothetical protein
MSALALLISLGGVAGAGGDLFSDIGSHAFRAQINRIGRAGCASGFDDGTFRPNGNVTRGQFAFWTNNCGGRAAFDDGQTTLTAPSDAELLNIHLTGGGTNTEFAQGGFVVVTAAVDAEVTTDVAQCPCRIDASVHDVNDDDDSGIRIATLAGTPDSSGSASASLSVVAVFPIDADETKEFELNVSYGDNQSPDITFRGDMSAVFVPFGADGDRAFDNEP